MTPNLQTGNVVKMQDFSAQRNGQPTASAGDVLEACRRLSLGILKQAVAGVMDRVDDALFDLADKAVNNAAQERYFDAMREVRLKRAGVEAEFGRCVEDAFHAVGRPGQDKPRNDADGLGLVELDDLEESLAAENMADKVRDRSWEVLAELDQRLGMVLGRPGLEGPENPLGPENLFEAFRQACDVIESGLEVRLLVLKLFDRYGGAVMDGMYQQVNRLLVQRGILPELPKSVARPPVRRNAGPVAPLSADSAGNASESPGSAAEEDLFGLMERFLNRGAVTATGFSQGSATRYSGGLGITVDATTLSALTRLQQGDADSLGLQGYVWGDVAEGTNVLQAVKEARVLGDPQGAGSLTLDVVSMMFDFILGDPNIPAPMKALIGRLQIPVLKVALLDKSLFSHKNHPTRQLLNTLAEAALAWSEESDPDQTLLRKIEAIVQRVLDEFDQDITLFSELKQELDEFQDEEQQAAEIRESRLAEEVRGKERGVLARLEAREILSGRLAADDVPRTVRTFLQNHWSEVLVDTYLGEGPDSGAWKVAVETVDILIWSTSPKATPGERRRLMGLLPELLRRLKQGMQRISLLEAEQTRFLVGLADYHARAIRGESLNGGTNGPSDGPSDGDQSPKPEPTGASQPANNPETGAVQTESALPLNAGRHAQEATLASKEDQDMPVEDEFVTRARALDKGAWLQFTRDDGRSIRARLSWKSSVTGTYFFTSRQGVKWIERSLEVLARELRQGKAEVLDDTPLFDRVVSNVMDTLQVDKAAK